MRDIAEIMVAVIIPVNQKGDLVTEIVMQLEKYI